MHLAPIWNDVAGLARVLSTGGQQPPAAPPDGDGVPVLLVPGLLAGDGSLGPLAARLVAAGHRPWRASVARNVACSEAIVDRLVAQLERARAHHGRHVLVGHSRGGLIARVIARRRPDLVTGVITLGSPHRDQLAIHPVVWAQVLMLAVAGTLGVPGFMQIGCAAGTCCAAFRRDLAAPPAHGVGRLAIYSRADAVVDWRACRDEEECEAEVHAGHCAMTTDAPTLHLVTRAVERFGAAHLSNDVFAGRQTAWARKRSERSVDKRSRPPLSGESRAAA